MVVTYYIKLFRTEADKQNGILMSVLLLVAETKNLKLLLQHSFIQAATWPTRIYKHNAALIDHVNKNYFIGSSIATEILKVNVSGRFSPGFL